MIVYRCKQKGCNNLALAGQRYCSKHIEQHRNKYSYSNQYEKRKVISASNKKYNETKRDKAANEFYHSKQWQQVRSYVVNRDMYSSAVSHKVIPDSKLIVDHIIPRRLCKDKLDTDNLWCLSMKEHNIKTKIEQSLNDNQLKHISRDWWIKVINERIKK